MNMNELLFEMIIVAVLYVLSAAACLRCIIYRRIHDHETFENMSSSSCLIMIGLSALTLLTMVFEVVWAVQLAGGGV